MIKIDKILIILLLIVLIFSISITYYKTIYKKNFEVINTEEVSEFEIDQNIE